MRIVIFEPNWIGDIILTTPIPKALKETFPQASVSCILPSRGRDILSSNPYIDETITFDERNEQRSLKKKLNFIKKLRCKRFDLSIILHRSFTRALIIYLAGIKERIGYAYPKRAFLITKKIPPLNKNTIHKQDYYLNILEATGIKIEDKNCKVYPSYQATLWAERLLKEYKKKHSYLVGINPFTNWDPKNWPLEYFQELIQRVNSKYPQIIFFLTGSNYFDFSLSSQENVINLSGQTNLSQLIALYDKLDLVISGDSGPLHLSAALNTKYIGIYGATSPKLNGPRASTEGKIIFLNKECALPCYVSNCTKNFNCMRMITPDKVEKALEELLFS